MRFSVVWGAHPPPAPRPPRARRPPGLGTPTYSQSGVDAFLKDGDFVDEAAGNRDVIALGDAHRDRPITHQGPPAHRRRQSFESGQSSREIGKLLGRSELQASGQRIERFSHSLIKPAHGLLHGLGQNRKARGDAVANQGEDGQVHRLGMRG
ncbi:MAG TPA: hypothetical protein VEL48_04285, partial [Candidatus Acidoferrales bacterium]|nr:hypothetical protein [Candidatus Acidoferrales bacterium]